MFIYSFIQYHQYTIYLIYTLCLSIFQEASAQKMAQIVAQDKRHKLHGQFHFEHTKNLKNNIPVVGLIFFIFRLKQNTVILGSL